MINKIISIALGIILVLGIGYFVYQGSNASIPSGGTQEPKKSVSQTSVDDDDEEEIEDGLVKENPDNVTTKPQTTNNLLPSGITMNEVATHSTRESCWSAINSNVYDLTSWIPNHPGGEKPILSVCGKDGSSLFNGKHAGNAQVVTALGGFKIGVLSK